MIRKLISGLSGLFFIFKKRKLDFKPKKILLIRSGAIGDVIMTTPLIKILKENFKDSSIDYLVGDWSKKALDNNPYIDKIINFNDNIIINRKTYEINKLIKRLRKEKYDLCIILDKHFLWNLFALKLKPGFRIGFDRAGEGFPNNISVLYNGSKYELDYYLDIAKKLNLKIIKQKPEIYISKKDTLIVNKLLNKNKNFIAIAPGGAKNPGQKLAVKRYPKEKYLEIIKKLSKKHKIVLIGGKEDTEITKYLLKNIKNKKNIKDLAGKTTIQQTAIIIGKAKLLITNDSGAMHIASTTNTKIIAIFGPTDPRRFAPRNTVVIRTKKCKPCYDMYGKMKKCRLDCYSDIKAVDVLKVINRFI